MCHLQDRGRGKVQTQIVNVTPAYKPDPQYWNMRQIEGYEIDMSHQKHWCRHRDLGHSYFLSNNMDTLIGAEAKFR